MKRTQKQAGITPVQTVIIIGIIVVAVAFLVIRKSSAPAPETTGTPGTTQTTQTTQNPPAVETGNDLDKVSADLDSTDTNSLDTDLNQLSSDASSF